ncbi:DUF2274 domain-containing protein [Sphingobium cloacae]|uniref:DUF2274 domain-containing protein n=1 Tax=Sphingobium cloacae TaxID=120107 RepID=UPI000833EA22|nr:DUF2274 domain-containing protein [Sphingobium cloacae]
MRQKKIGPLVDDRPVKLSIELPATIHRDLVDYGAALVVEKLVAPMLARFMATDRAFAKAKRSA